MSVTEEGITLIKLKMIEKLHQRKKIRKIKKKLNKVLQRETMLRDAADVVVKNYIKKIAEKKVQTAESNEVSDLQQATLMLGLEGVFHLPDGKIMFGSGGNQQYIREHLRRLNEKNLDFKSSKTDKINFKQFKNALEADETDDREKRLRSAEAVIVEVGWETHFIGMYAFIEKNKSGESVIKLIVCNRGGGYDSLKRPENERYSGNVTYRAPCSKKAIQVINDLNQFVSKNPEDFYEYFYQRIGKGGYTFEKLQKLKSQKIGNCILANQKSLMAAILSKNLYKQITTQMRKEQIDFLIKKIEKAKNLDECVEFEILKQYLYINFASALHDKKTNKIVVMEYAISKLEEVKKVFENKTKNRKNSPDDLKNLSNQVKKSEMIIEEYNRIKKIVNALLLKENIKEPAERNASSIGIFAVKKPKLEASFIVKKNESRLKK